uniref:Pecanex-like protein n=1 Tax=Schistocephalus solidus TaxID=70667 RepID=A0A183S8N3_SCHSO
LPTLDNLDTSLRICNLDDSLQVLLMIEAGSDGFATLDTFQNFWVLTLWKLSSVLMAFTDSESCAGLHAEGNIAGSVDLTRLISQSTANIRSSTYLLV